MIISSTNISSRNGVTRYSYKTITSEVSDQNITTASKLQMANELASGFDGTLVIPKLDMVYHSWNVGLNTIPDKSRYNVFTNAYSQVVWARIIETDYEYVEDGGIYTLKFELRSLANYVRGVTATVTADGTNPVVTDIVYWDNLHKVDQDYIDSYDWFVIYYDNLTDKFRWPIVMKVSDTEIVRLRVDGDNDRTQNNVIIQTTAFSSLTDYQAGVVYPSSSTMNMPLLVSRKTDINAMNEQIEDNKQRLDLILSERSSLFVSR